MALIDSSEVSVLQGMWTLFWRQNWSLAVLPAKLLVVTLPHKIESPCSISGGLNDVSLFHCYGTESPCSIIRGLKVPAPLVEGWLMCPCSIVMGLKVPVPLSGDSKFLLHCWHIVIQSPLHHKDAVWVSYRLLYLLLGTDFPWGMTALGSNTSVDQKQSWTVKQ